MSEKLINKRNYGISRNRPLNLFGGRSEKPSMAKMDSKAPAQSIPNDTVEAKDGVLDYTNVAKEWLDNHIVDVFQLMADHADSNEAFVIPKDILSSDEESFPALCNVLTDTVTVKTAQVVTAGIACTL